MTSSVPGFAGSLYLIFLGVQMIWDVETQGAAELRVSQVRRRSFASIVWQGVLVEVLNPKTILFFLLFIPPFVEVSGGEAGSRDVVWQMLILGALVPLTAVPSDVVVAFVGGSLAQTVNGNRLIRRGLAWLGGLFLIGIGVNLLIGIGESLVC